MQLLLSSGSDHTRRWNVGDTAQVMDHEAIEVVESIRQRTGRKQWATQAKEKCC
jgi:hypothetical protein